MRFQFVKKPSRPATPRSPEEILAKAGDFFRAELPKDFTSLIADKAQSLQSYDVQAMDRIVAILAWGRSGSVLLASYFDGHEDVIMLPELCGWRLHEFFERYPSLSLRDKLIAYTAFDPEYVRFFDGDFAILPAHYYAAVQAIHEFARSWPPEFSKSRRAFFVFVHIAYTLALGRQPSSARPLIVYAQHERDDSAGRLLVEDFPQARFIHTVRDPIAACDAAFHYLAGALAQHHMLLPYSLLYHMTSDRDRPHCGMESRTRVVRFEDLHFDPAQILQDLCDWLGLRYQPNLHYSTFNGVPYVVTRDGVAWAGRRLAQTERRSRYFSRKDQALLYALFHANFVQWRYPCPKIFEYPIARVLVLTSLLLAPMKTEIWGARAIMKQRMLPALRRGDMARVIKSLLGIGLCRLRIMRLLAGRVFQRSQHRPALLQVDQQTQLPPTLTKSF